MSATTDAEYLSDEHVVNKVKDQFWCHLWTLVAQDQPFVCDEPAFSPFSCYIDSYEFKHKQEDFMRLFALGMLSLFARAHNIWRDSRQNVVLSGLSLRKKFCMHMLRFEVLPLD